MIKKFLVLAAISGIIFAACDKEETPEPTPAPVAPTITINDPKKAEYEVGETAVVNVVVTDADELHEAKCWFITRPQNDTLWNLKRHSHSKTININSTFLIPELPEEQKVDFVVWAENEAGKTTTVTHSFEVHDH